MSRTGVCQNIAAWIVVASASFLVEAVANDEFLVGTTQFTGFESRMAEYERRLAAVENNAEESFELRRDAENSYEESVGYPCYSTGATIGAELVFLKVFQSEGSAGSFDYNPAPRLWAGWTTATGLGARARWFHYNNARLGHPGNDEYEILTFDVELTDNFELTDYLTATITGGVRYAEFQELVATTVPPNGLSNGLGPLLGIEFYRYLGPNLSLFSLGRASLQYGDGQGAGAALFNDNRTASILELQLGAQWNRQLASGATAFVRGAWEGQWWGGVSGNDSENAGLMGGTFAMGIMR